MRLVLCAGEASGDILGAGLIEAIRERCPEARFEGIAGPRMQALGCRSLIPMEKLSVMGLVEVAGRYLELLPQRRALARRFIEDPPDAFIGIDAPDFNLSLERNLRRAGIPTVHYVSPSVWAWREYRVKTIRRSVDLMLVLFPFEQAFYRRHGIQVELVGHHLADRIPMQVDPLAARESLGLPRDAQVVALLPGSRLSEVNPLSGPMLEAALWILRRRPDVQFLVPLATPAVRQLFQAKLALVASRPGAQGLTARVRCLDGESHAAMSASDVVLLASGTASLEALLLKRPMVITYRTHPLTWAIGRRLLKVPYVGLPNLLAGEEVSPELLQDRATPQALGAAVLGLLDRPEQRARQVSRFDRIHRELRRNASKRAADAVLALVGTGGGGR
jgi:lipid-A-disaccharide synthase